MTFATATAALSAKLEAEILLYLDRGIDPPGSLLEQWANLNISKSSGGSSGESGGANQTEIKAAIESATNLNELEQLLRVLATEATLIQVKDELALKSVYPIDQPTLILANSNQVYSRNFSNICWINFICRENIDIFWHYLPNKVNTSNAYTLLAGNTGKLEFGERKWSGSLYFLSTTPGVNLEIWGYSYEESIPPLDYSTLDPQVQAYRNAIIDVDSTISDPSLAAINDFVLTLKSNNLWDKCKLIAPFAGNTASAALIALKFPNNFLDNPIISGISSSLSYSETTGFRSTGNAYINLNYAGDLYQSSLDSHMSVYLANMTLFGTSTFLGGYYTNTSSGSNSDIDNNFSIKHSSSDNQIKADVNDTGYAVGATTEVKGHFIANILFENGNNNINLYKNGASIASNAFSGIISSTNGIRFYALAEYTKIDANPVAATNFSKGDLRFVSIGSAFTSSEAVIFNTAVQALMQSLGRGV